MAGSTQPMPDVAPSPSKEDQSAHREIIIFASVASLLLKERGEGNGETTMRNHFTSSYQQDINVSQYHILMTMWKKEISHMRLVRVWVGAAILAFNLEIIDEIKDVCAL